MYDFSLLIINTFFFLEKNQGKCVYSYVVHIFLVVLGEFSLDFLLTVSTNILTYIIIASYFCTFKSL